MNTATLIFLSFLLPQVAHAAGSPALSSAPVLAVPPSVQVSTAAANIELRGLLILGDPKEVRGTGTPDVRGVAVRVPFLDRADFKARMSPFLGRPITKPTRNEILAAVIMFCREQGRPLVDISLPPQEITGGVLQVLALESKLGQVQIQGNRWFTTEHLTRQLRARPGQYLDSRLLSGDLDWLNRNPFRQADLVYQKGSEPGTTDLVIRETDRLPLRFYAGWEDSGTKVTGNDRLLGGMDWGNVFGRDGQLNLQYMADPRFMRFGATSLNLVQPLPWRHILTVFGSYTTTRGNLPKPFSLEGFNDQLGLRYAIPLPELASKRLDLRGSITAGFDFKRANNNLAFGGTQVFGAVTDTLQWNLGYNAGLKDPWGETALRATFFYSPGKWSVNDFDAAYRRSRAGATARYSYVNAELDRTTGLPFGFTLMNRLTAQAADSNLLAGEQLGFGGYDTIRGYDTRVVNSDEGLILNNELRAPAFRVLAHLGLRRLQDQLQFLGFYDYGSARNRHRLSGEAKSTALSGVGAGARYSISGHFSFRADYGWQLRNVEVKRAYASRFHLGLILSY